MRHMTLGRPHVGVTTTRCTPRMSLFAAMLGLALSSPALAQPPPAPEASNTDASVQARQLYKDGLKEAARGKWEGARKLFAEAFRRKPHVQIALNLGHAEFKVGKHRDAAEHLSYFLREAPKIEPDDRKKTEELLEQAKTKVGTLRITARPDGAEIRIDGVSVDPAALKGEVFVEPGVHLVEARLEGYEPMQATRDVGAGWREQIDLRLIKAEPEKGVVTPMPTPVVPPTPMQENGASTTVVVIGTIASIGAAGAGIAFTVASEVQRSKRGDEKPSCAVQLECDRYNKAEIARAELGNVAIASGVAAGVLGVATLTYVLATRPAKPKSAARVDLVLGVGTARAMVTVDW
jgi:hypothetical protein